MMGAPDQLMDLSLTHPYPGDSRLADRVLANAAFREQYQRVLADLSATVFSSERLLAEIASFEETTRDVLAREAEARAARGEPAGFAFGPPGGAIPQAPDLRTFVEKRHASIESQLAGRSQGYLPQFNFGPPPPGPRSPSWSRHANGCRSGRELRSIHATPAVIWNSRRTCAASRPAIGSRPCC